MKKRHLKITLSRRAKLIIVGVIVVLVALGTALYLFVVKIDKEARSSLVTTSESVDVLTSDVNKKLSDATVSANDKIALVKKYGSDLTSAANSLCSEQENRAYSAFVSTLNRCNLAESHLRDAVSTLNTMSRYIEAETALATVIPANLNDLTFLQSYEVWSGALTNLEAISTPEELNDQKTALLKAMTDYRDAWKALIDADSARDETAFTAAEEQLQKNHQALLNSAQNTAEPLSQMQSKLTTQMNAFFEESKAS